MNSTKRTFDLLFAMIVGTLTIVPMIFIAVLIKLDSKGPILYWSARMGYQNKVFLMPKFRSMQIRTPTLPTHLLTDPNQYLTGIGKYLRKTSLDELPQIWSILRGDMSVVGPRPALFNQQDLIELRNKNGIQLLMPGLTGWAQVNGRDELDISEKVGFDLEYLQCKSLLFDLKILSITIKKIFSRDGISH